MSVINFRFSYKVFNDFFKLLVYLASKSYLIINVLPSAFISRVISSLYSLSTFKEFDIIWATWLVGNVKFTSLYTIK